MTDNTLDRPASLKRAPKPAPDNTADPIEPSVPIIPPKADAAEYSYSTPVPKRRLAARREATVPLSTRVSLEVDSLLQAVKDSGEVASIRAAIEEAVLTHWAKYRRVGTDS